MISILFLAGLKVAEHRERRRAERYLASIRDRLLATVFASGTASANIQAARVGFVPCATLTNYGAPTAAVAAGSTLAGYEVRREVLRQRAKRLRNVLAAVPLASATWRRASQLYAEVARQLGTIERRQAELATVGRVSLASTRSTGLPCGRGCQCLTRCKHPLA